MDMGRAVSFFLVVVALCSANLSCGNPVRVIEEPVSAQTCAAVDGTFVATDFGFTGVADPGIAETFDEPGTRFELAFDEEAGAFTSTFVEPGLSPVIRTGDFAIKGGNIVLSSDPLIPGIQPELATGTTGLAFACEQVKDSLVLSDEQIGFDFDNDGIFEPARFDATFAPV